MKRSRRSRTGLIAAIVVVLGLAVGTSVGLLVGWVVWPVRFVDTSLADLAADSKDEYMLLVASAYAVDGDLERAQARLAQLELPDVNQSLAAVIDRYLLEGRDGEEIRALASLGHSLGVNSPQSLAHLAPPTDMPRLPTHMPEPTGPLAAQWTWNAELLGPAIEPGQSCTGGAQYIRVTVLDAKGIQLDGIWVHELHTGQTQVTGHKGEDPAWGPGEAEVPCPGNRSASICIATDASGTCASGYTRDMSCWKAPSFKDLWAAGYCECCGGADITKARCQELYDAGAQCMRQNRYYAWHVTFRRSW